MSNATPPTPVMHGQATHKPVTSTRPATPMRDALTKALKPLMGMLALAAGLRGVIWVAEQYTFTIPAPMERAFSSPAPMERTFSSPITPMMDDIISIMEIMPALMTVIAYLAAAGFVIGLIKTLIQAALQPIRGR